MLCFQLHQQESGCGQEIPENAPGDAPWKFCPNCGRATGHLVVLKPEGLLNVPAQTASVRAVTLRNEGLTPVNVDLDLDQPLPGVQFSLRQRRVELPVNPRMGLQVELDIPALEGDTNQLGTLVIRAQDAALDLEEDPWQARKRRDLRLQLAAEVDTPADLHAIEEIALFREGVAERTITLVNSGMTRADILEVMVPDGYEVKLEGDKTRLGGREEVLCHITRKPNTQPAPEALLQFRTDGKPPPPVTLRNAIAEGIRSLPVAIIGIDFGTTFSSIAFRACRYNPARHDEVEFLLPEGETNARFPTRIWVSKQGDMEFGTEADRHYDLDPSAGFRFREIKTLLRAPQAAQIDPLRFREAALRQMQGLYGTAWGEALITEYLKWFYRGRILPELRRRFDTVDVDVHYVFSLPVLDFNIAGQPQYELQYQTMRQCVRRAGFPVHDDPAENRVEFEFEPVCAALGLLHPPADVQTDTTGEGVNDDKWPVLGSPGYPAREGQTIAVFDSGGGTTDVVLARIHEEQDAQGIHLSLKIERCLGVGSEAETFGGEWVTDRIQEALTNPASVKDSDGRVVTDWYQGEANFEGLQATGIVEDDAALIEREKAEEIKFQLAGEQDYPVPLSSDRWTLIRPFLLIRLITQKLLSITKELDQRVFKADERKNTTHYLLVGGNTRLPFLRKWVQGLMNDKFIERQLSFPEQYRRLAVAHGAAWIPDARVRNQVPYDLSVTVGSAPFLTLPRNQSQDMQPRSRPYALPPGAPLTVLLTAVIGAKSYCVRSKQIENPYNATCRVEVWGSLQNGELRIEYRLSELSSPIEKAPLKPLLEYLL